MHTHVSYWGCAMEHQLVKKASEGGAVYQGCSTSNLAGGSVFSVERVVIIIHVLVTPLPE